MQVPERRILTTPANLIDLRAVRRVATFLRRREPDFCGPLRGQPGQVRRGTSLRGCLTRAMARARAEQDARANDVFSGACDVVDGIIYALHRGDTSAADSTTRQRAIVALAAGRAAFLERGTCDNQLALQACAAVNAGAVSLRRFMELHALNACHPRAWYAAHLLDALCPLNARASAMLADAQAWAQARACAQAA